MFGLLSYFYGFTPDYIYGSLTWPQVRMYLAQIPVLEFRRHLPMARQTATIMNALGGKAKPDAEPSDVVLYNDFELLPRYALPEDMVFNTVGVTEAAAADFFRMTRAGKLPSWVIGVADVEMFRLAGRMG